MTTEPTASSLAAKASGLVLLTLATGQFVMALDMTVMKADTSGWTVVSMKDDFATVFAAADRGDATAARPAVKAV